MKPSRLGYGDGKGEINSSIRQSHDCVIDRNTNDPVIRWIQHQISQMANIPWEHAEGLAIVRYLPGQSYQLHHDTSEESTKKQQIKQRGLDKFGPRIKTFICYLTDDFEGGETAFPHIKFKTKGLKGDAIEFNNTHRDGSRDLRMVHGGLPVISGEKWIANQWYRESPIHKL